jgi:Domain of unknown function (DU1801)
MNPRIRNAAVARVFAGYPARVRRKLLALRALIFRTAASLAGVGRLEETLKWGEPAYVTAESKSGSTIRIERFRQRFPGALTFEGNRVIVLDQDGKIPAAALASCIASAPTYHRAGHPAGAARSGG